MPGGKRQFEFVGKDPLIFGVVVSVLFANTIAMLLVDFAGKYFLPKDVPEAVQWYENHSVAIQFVLLAVLAAILLAFRKRVRYVRQR